MLDRVMVLAIKGVPMQSMQHEHTGRGFRILMTCGWASTLLLSSMFIPIDAVSTRILDDVGASPGIVFGVSHLSFFSVAAALLAVAFSLGHVASRVPLIVVGAVLCTFGLARHSFGGTFGLFPLVLDAVDGADLGIGSACLTCVWLCMLFCKHEGPDVRTIMLGVIVASCLYLITRLMPPYVVVLVALIVVLPCSVICALRVGGAGSVLLSSDAVQKVGASPKSCCELFREARNDALYYGALAFVCGVCLGFVLDERWQGAEPAVSIVLATYIVALVFLYDSGEIIERVQVATLFRRMYPIAIVIFVAFPFVPENMEWAFGITAASAFGPLMVHLIASSAKSSCASDGKVVAVLGIASSVALMAHFSGVILGGIADEALPDGATKAAVVAAAITLVIGIVSAVFMRDVLRAGVTVEGLKSTQHHAECSNSVDEVARRVARMKQGYDLSEREAQVVDSLARGNGVARTAELLYLSESTVQTYVRRIYAKLGVRKRQEFFDVLNKQ